LRQVSRLQADLSQVSRVQKLQRVPSFQRITVSTPQANSMRGPGSKPSLLFQLLIPATAIFIITILSLIAVLFSDQRAPLAIFLNKHGNSLLAAEFVAVMLLSFLAMAADRIQTLRAMKSKSQEAAKAESTDPAATRPESRP
jgi:hypothetical protein